MGTASLFLGTTAPVPLGTTSAVSHVEVSQDDKHRRHPTKQELVGIILTLHPPAMGIRFAYVPAS